MDTETAVPRDLGERGRKLLFQAGTVVRHGRERTVHWQGDPASHGFLVLAGGARAVKARHDGSRMPLATLSAGEWLGLCETVADVPYLSDGVILPGCELLILAQPALKRLMQEGEVSPWIGRHLALTACRLHAHLESRSPLEKLRSFLLLRAASSTPGTHRIDLTQEALAEAVGFTRETVNRHLKEMEASGLIRVERGGLTLLDLEGLRKQGA